MNLNPAKPMWDFVPDPMRLKSILWPEVVFYDKQKEVIYSVEENDETLVPAGNMLGKDFVTAFIAVSCFLRYPVCRIVTTSVKDDHLRVLWGEIGRFIQTAKYPLVKDRGGILSVNHRDITKLKRPYKNNEVCPISYLRGMVSEKGEGMAGHHAPFTLFIGDEASGIDDVVYTQADGWARKKLIIGNPNPCDNFFKRLVKAGDLIAS